MVSLYKKKKKKKKKDYFAWCLSFSTSRERLLRVAVKTSNAMKSNLSAHRRVDQPSSAALCCYIFNTKIIQNKGGCPGPVCFIQVQTRCHRAAGEA